VQKVEEKKIKYKGLYVVVTTNVTCDMYDYTGNNPSHRNSNRRFKGKFGSQTRKTFVSLQKTAIFGTLHVIQKVLQAET
jgi:hypothetical protein